MASQHRRAFQLAQQTLRQALIWLIKGYQRVVSPLFPPRCRFQPTCSAYAVEAIQVCGVWIGSWLILKRLVKCHPGHPGGFDPVPTQKETL